MSNWAALPAIPRDGGGFAAQQGLNSLSERGTRSPTWDRHCLQSLLCTRPTATWHEEGERARGAAWPREKYSPCWGLPETGPVSSPSSSGVLLSSFFHLMLSEKTLWMTWNQSCLHHTHPSTTPLNFYNCFFPQKCPIRQKSSRKRFRLRNQFCVIS